MARYAEIGDFVLIGLPAKALVGVSPDALNAALDAASAEMDGYFNASPDITLPIITWGQDIRLNCCRMSALTVMTVRGFDPSKAGIDGALLAEYRRQGEQWCLAVSRGAIVPVVTDSSSPAGSYPTPEITSLPPAGWLGC